MKKTSLITLLILLMLVLAGCGSHPGTKEEPVNLTVSAATSLKDAVEEIGNTFTKSSGISITYNFASSGTLQKQIEEGAPVDLFISAGLSQMDALAGQDLILEETRRNLLSNEIVLITRDGNNLSSFAELAGSDIKKISIGTPKTVPAGKYAKETLTSLELWDKIQNKLVLAKDVRQVLTYVETGNVDAGLLYRTDVLNAEGIRIAAVAPAGSHAPIVYPMAVLKSTAHLNEAEAFAEFLSGEEAAQIFSQHGFVPLVNSH